MVELLTQVENWVRDHFNDNISKDYFFHDIQHTQQVVEATKEIGLSYSLSEKDALLLTIAAWFHDTGYNQGPENHESRGADYAKKFLQKNDFSEEDIRVVMGCIMATKMPQTTTSLLEQIIADADVAHLGKGIYWDRVNKLRQELLLTRGINMNEMEWVNFEIDFISNHNYHTIVSRGLYDVQKNKHLKQLKKQRKRLIEAEEESSPSLDDMMMNDRKIEREHIKNTEALIKSERELKQLRIGRGVETMYRTTYNTHLHLSAQADSKANLMLSVNAIIISISISSLVPQFPTNPRLIIPTVLLLLTCLIAMVLATVSTRPKVTEGKITREDILQRKGNLLFFGNFFKMPLDEFQWGVTEMIKDSNYLYSSMTRDIYYLGVVLAKKYHYLSYCYNSFMYGLIISVISFGIAYIFY